MEELFSAIETGSVDKVKEVIVNQAVSPTVCSEVSSTMLMCCSYVVYSNTCMYTVKLLNDGHFGTS